VDFTDAVARFQTLQTALQASLQTGARILNLSLLDFLG
jgi:flagellin-like hook-associated protein FlgL